MQKDGGEIVVNGRFSLGFPRRDKGEEINGRIRVTKWTAADFKHAFDIDDYDVEGMVSGEYHLYGPYQGPFGFGTLTIDNGVAYGEPFETASGSLRFEGNGVRIDGIQMRKSGGTAEGAAFVGWNGTYSFNATGRRIPLEGVKAMAYPQAPLTGLLEFNADGTGTFDVPRYQFRGRIRDLFVADEGVGEVTGRLDVRGDTHDDRDRGGLAASRGVGHRPHRSHRDAGRRHHAALHRHVARSVRARVREAPLAVHDGRRQRHAARHRRAREPRAARRRRDVRPAADPRRSTIRCATRSRFAC